MDRLSALSDAEHFTGFPFVTMDFKMSNASIRELLGCEPSHPGLIADFEQGHCSAAE